MISEYIQQIGPCIHAGVDATHAIPFWISTHYRKSSARRPRIGEPHTSRERRGDNIKSCGVKNGCVKKRLYNGHVHTEFGMNQTTPSHLIGCDSVAYSHERVRNTSSECATPSAPRLGKWTASLQPTPCRALPHGSMPPAASRCDRRRIRFRSMAHAPPTSLTCTLPTAARFPVPSRIQVCTHPSTSRW